MTNKFFNPKTQGKKYTIVSLLKEVSALNSTSFSSVNVFAAALSPKTKVNSVKFKKLNFFLNNKVKLIINSNVNCNSKKNAISSLLKARQSN